MPFFLLVNEGKHHLSSSPHLSLSLCLSLSLTPLFPPSLSSLLSLTLSLSLSLSLTLFFTMFLSSHDSPKSPFWPCSKCGWDFMPWMGYGIFASTITRIHRVVSRKHKGHTTTKTSPKFRCMGGGGKPSWASMCVHAMSQGITDDGECDLRDPRGRGFLFYWLIRTRKPWNTRVTPQSFQAAKRKLHY